MKQRQAFANALKELRKYRGMTQEDFSLVSSRTYISILERGLKSPTLEKVDQLAKAMKIHPMTLLAYAYMKMRKVDNLDELCGIIRAELPSCEISASRQ